MKKLILTASLLMFVFFVTNAQNAVKPANAATTTMSATAAPPLITQMHRKLNLIQRCMIMERSKRVQMGIVHLHLKIQERNH